MKSTDWVQLFRSIKDKKPNFLSNNSFIFFFCLFIASFLWFVNALSKQYQTDIQFKVRYSNMPDDLVLVSQPVERLYLYTESSGYNLFTHHLRSSPTITIDYNRVGRGAMIPSNALLGEINTQLPPDIRVLSVHPDTIYLDFDYLLQKKVPVTIEKNIQYRRQYNLFGSVRILPDSITVSGPITYVDDIKSWPTDTVKMEDVNRSIEMEVALKKPENPLIKLNNSQVRIFLPVEQFTEKVMEAEVRAIGISNDRAFSIFPKTIQVNALVPVSRYDRIQSGMFEFVADFSQINLDIDTRVPVEVSVQPDEVKNLRYSPTSLEFIFYDEAN